MRQAAGGDDRHALVGIPTADDVGEPAADRVAALRARQRRRRAIDENRDHPEPRVRIEPEQGDHEAVVHLPILCHGPVNALVESALDEIAREAEIAWHMAVWNAEWPGLGFDGPGKLIEHSNAERRH